MKKLLFAVFLFISCAVMAGMPDANCPADRPLADWDGKCYSCDEDRDLYSVNGPCEEVCPNRLYLSPAVPVQDWAGCVLDTPENRALKEQSGPFERLILIVMIFMGIFMTLGVIGILKTLLYPLVEFFIDFYNKNKEKK